MGLSFYLADNIEDIGPSVPHTVFEIDLARYLYENPDKFPPEAGFFLNLNPYGDETFDAASAGRIANVCRAVLATELDDVQLGESLNVRDFHPFAQQLLDICSQAMENSSHVLVLGD